VALPTGTLDTLLDFGWVRPRGRRRTPGRPVTWGTTTEFLDHFGLSSLDALPGFDELKAAGLIDARPAVTAMGQRGGLPAAGEVEAEEDPLEDGDDPLEADFGEAFLQEAPETEDGEPADAPVATLEEIAPEEVEEPDGEAPERRLDADRPIAALQNEIKEALGG
jgi:segregation and condensation protein B